MRSRRMVLSRMMKDNARVRALRKLQNYETVEQVARFRCRGFEEGQRARLPLRRRYYGTVYKDAAFGVVARAGYKRPHGLCAGAVKDLSL
jgi:hypothetical protein